MWTEVATARATMVGILGYFSVIHTSSDRLINIVENNSYEFRVCKILGGTLSIPKVCKYLEIHLLCVQTHGSTSLSFQILGMQSVPGLCVIPRRKCTIPFLKSD